MKIKEYYQNHFKNDIIKFMVNSTVPYFGHNWEHNCENLNKINEANRPFFLVCLYFTVLVDQMMYTYYKADYEYFENLTKYPKFCFGLNQYQKNPRKILYIPFKNNLVDNNKLLEIIDAGMKLFVDEVIDFFKSYLKNIKVEDFFEKLKYDSDIQIPEIFALTDPNIKNKIEYITYKSLVKQIDLKFSDSR